MLGSPLISLHAVLTPSHEIPTGSRTLTTEQTRPPGSANGCAGAPSTDLIIPQAMVACLFAESSADKQEMSRHRPVMRDLRRHALHVSERHM